MPECHGMANNAIPLLGVFKFLFLFAFIFFCLPGFCSLCSLCQLSWLCILLINDAILDTITF